MRKTLLKFNQKKKSSAAEDIGIAAVNSFGQKNETYLKHKLDFTREL